MSIKAKAAKVPPAAAAAEEPAAKKAKTDEAEAKPEVEKYQEPDAPKDSRPALKEKIVFEAMDTTLNVVPTCGGKMLNCLTEGGMSCLLAGARANVGQKAGRYMFETKMMNNMGSGKHAVRIGFSTEKAGLILGEDAHSIFFDSESSTFVAAKKRTNVKNGKFGGSVVAVVLNLDSKSPNANTLALYKDGAAVGEPMPIPEEFKGQALFPHVTFRSASAQVNFGDASKPLPFKCRTLQSAAASDVIVAPSKTPKDGKYEVVLPVAFPDQGGFEWLDSFMAKNPQYVELSDRKIMQWAQASGHHQKGQKQSNDKPHFNFDTQDLNNPTVRSVIRAVAPILPRNYVVMEVKSNLLAADRAETLKKFNYPCYKKSARVVMGEPNKEFKGMVREKLLKQKQAKADNVFKAKQAEAVRKKAMAARQKEAEKKKKEAEKKRAAEKKKKEDEEKKAKGETVEEKEEEKEVEEEEKVEEAEEEPEPPVVELDEEEKKINFLPSSTPDLTQQVMSQNYAKFTTPEEDEGFDNIVYEWQKADKAAAYLKKWVMEKKLTTRMDDLKPGQAFREKKAEFEKLAKDWKAKLAAWKANPAKNAARKMSEDGDDDVDIFSVSDVTDVGKGVPLMERFTFEDWELMQLRFEFCWLVLSFKKDTDDADRVGIPKDHLTFYYQKYYGKSCSPKQYGMTTVEEVLGLIKDAVAIKEGLVVSQLSDDLDNLDIFLKLSEEHRRERQRRIDAGDETARLKFVPQAEPKPAFKPASKPEAAATPAKPAPKAEAAKTTAGIPAPKAKQAPVQKTTPAATPAPAQKGWGKGKGKGKW